MNQSKFRVERELQHRGICDASGAIALNKNHFAVANDEDNILRVYRADESGGARSDIAGTDLNGTFDNNPKNKEVDIEGAAQLGDIIYWITSHGTNKAGKPRPERRQLFANRLINDGDQQRFQPVGHAYSQLVEDMLQDERLSRYELAAAAKIPPKEKGGLNIEGLATTPNQELLIGFRNPIVQGKALLLPLTNPKELVEQKATALFGEPIKLDLNGLGIRSLEYWPSQNCYIIVAGAYDGSDRFALYQWSGLANENPQRIEVAGLPADFRPEAVLFYPHDHHRFQLLSDDGSITREGETRCKDIPDENHPHKYFRSLWIKREDS
jgi:hypothetical protein